MQSVRRELPDGGQLEIRFLSQCLLRVRIAPRGEPQDTGLNRYGFIREPAGAEEFFTIREDHLGLTAESAGLSLEWRDSGGLTVRRRADGATVLEQTNYAFPAGPARVRFRAAPDEDWVGFGDQTRQRLYHRGQRADLYVRNVASYIPVPFFMSTRGAGVLVNTTHRILFDLAKTEPDHYFWDDGRGAVDYYLFVGDSFRELLNLYTDLTGKPQLPPYWSFGLWYICRTWANDIEVVNDALNFRREEIPCDVIGLEPGWMNVPIQPQDGFPQYDKTTKKDWSIERFPLPGWAKSGPHTFISALKRMGFKLELWQCCEYDFSYEAERRAGRPTPRPGGPGAFHADGEVDEHFAMPRLSDPDVKPEEPWFEHLKKFVDQGADFFKQDGAWQVSEHSDRIWGNGMTDAEMHNLYPLLYARQMNEGFEAHTGRRALVFTVAGWAGFQAWCGTWTGDTGGRLETLGAMLNTALAGHSFTTNDMEVMQKEGMHFGYLQPWSQINSWAYFRMPWLQGRELLAMHRAYAQLRSRLTPYLYSWAREATRTGYPLLVPLTLEWQDDPRCREVLHEYLLGRDLLVVIYKPEAYLPQGRWQDFWTGEIHAGGRDTPIAWPEDRGGGLFLREGGIVPLGPLMQYRGEKPLDEVELLLFPGPEETGLELYEDDGVSLKHRAGEYAVTAIRQQAFATETVINIAAPQGSYAGQPQTRRWTLQITREQRPRTVSINGRELSPTEWSYDPARRRLTLPPQTGPLELRIAH